MKKIRFVEVKSEVGAGTRGASMGPDAIKIAAFDYGSNLFKKIESVEVQTENQSLFESPGRSYLLMCYDHLQGQSESRLT